MKKIYSASDDLFFESYQKAAKHYNVSRNVISNMIRGRTINIYKLKIV